MDARLLPLLASIRIVLLFWLFPFSISLSKQKSPQNFAIKEHKKLRLFADLFTQQTFFLSEMFNRLSISGIPNDIFFLSYCFVILLCLCDN